MKIVYALIVNKRWFLMVAVLLFSFLIVLSTPRNASAHTRAELPPYTIVVGWIEEPPLVGERNALSIEIHEETDDGAVPVSKVEGSLDAELVYAGFTFRSNINPTETPGLYTVDIFPTVRGQYSVRLFGTVGELAVDTVIAPEEVFPASRLQFPEAAPDPRALKAEITALETQLQAAQSAQTYAFVGIGVGLLGLILAVVALMRKPK